MIMNTVTNREPSDQMFVAYGSPYRFALAPFCISFKTLYVIIKLKFCLALSLVHLYDFPFDIICCIQVS